MGCLAATISHTEVLNHAHKARGRLESGARQKASKLIPDNETVSPAKIQRLQPTTEHRQRQSEEHCGKATNSAHPTASRCSPPSAYPAQACDSEPGQTPGRCRTRTASKQHIEDASCAQHHSTTTRLSENRTAGGQSHHQYDGHDNTNGQDHGREDAPFTSLMPDSVRT